MIRTPAQHQTDPDKMPGQIKRDPLLIMSEDLKRAVDTIMMYQFTNSRYAMTALQDLIDTADLVSKVLKGMANE